MKKCTKCKQDKDTSEFNKNCWKSDGLQTSCRKCSSDRSKQYYKENTEEHRIATKIRRDKRRKELKEKSDDIKLKYGCQTCDEKDIICLDFHHAFGNKEFQVSQGVSDDYAWETILLEIRKCVCLCASCHRKVHGGRFKVTRDMLCK